MSLPVREFVRRATMSFLSRLFGQSSANHPVIQPQEYQARFVDGKQSHTLVDVRTAEEFREGHISGAINIAVQELSGKLNKIPKDKPVVVYCRSGSRSAHAAQSLLTAGYAEVYDLGGLFEWARQGLPLKR
jgi:rhodanese-related sulfurtransferase